MPDRKAEQEHFQVPPVASLKQINDFYNPAEKHEPSKPLHPKTKQSSEPKLTRDQIVNTLHPESKRASQASVMEINHILHPDKFNK